MTCHSYRFTLKEGMHLGRPITGTFELVHNGAEPYPHFSHKAKRSGEVTITKSRNPDNSPRAGEWILNRPKTGPEDKGSRLTALFCLNPEWPGCFLGDSPDRLDVWLVQFDHDGKGLTIHVLPGRFQDRDALFAHWTEGNLDGVPEPTKEPRKALSVYNNVQPDTETETRNPARPALVHGV